MVSCLQSGIYHISAAYKIGADQNVNENTFVNVRKNSIILISNLLIQDYMKWRGLLLQRFLVSTVDSNEGVSRFAEATLCGPLLSKIQTCSKITSSPSFRVKRIQGTSDLQECCN